MNLANCVKRQSNTTWERAGGIANIWKSGYTFFRFIPYLHYLPLYYLIDNTCRFLSTLAAAIDLGGDGFSFSYYKIHI